MLSKIYLNYDLSFMDRHLEEKYQNSKIFYYRLLLNIVIMYGFLTGIVGWVMNPLNSPEYFNIGRIISLIVIVCSSLMFYLFGWRKPKICRVLLEVLVLLYFFAFMESSLSNQANWNGALYFIVGMNKEFIAISLILAKISWKTTSAMVLFMNLFCAFRYTNFENNYRMRFYPLVQYIMNTLLLNFSAYFMEKFDRENFYKINNYECSLSCFKDLITNSFPSAVLIMKGENILFKNQKTLTILECKEECLIHERIEGIDIEESHKNIENIENRKNRENNATEDCRPIINDKFNETSIRLPQLFLNHQTSNPKTYYGILESDGKKKSLEINLIKIIWEQEMSLMIIISENYLFEKMKVINEKSEYKDRLLATVSHDLRTPLNGIMGMIRTTMDINEDAQTRKYLNIALRSSQLLLLMINDILDYSQISNGRLRLNFETFCLWNVIKDVSKLFKFQTKMKGISFCKEKYTGEVMENNLIRSDQNRIKQVLFNLLGNALKFTVKGSIKIALKPWSSKRDPSTSCELIAEPNKGFLVSVEDTGIGIKQEDQGSLFKLFGKIHNESTNILNKSGVGLGLAISQSLVKILNSHKENGQISVRSEYGKGSCFSFVIFSEEEGEIKDDPFQKSFEEKSNNEMVAKLNILERKFDRISKKNCLGKHHPIIKKKKQILVVDDDQINVLVLTSFLSAFSKYDFDVAFNGEEAIKKIKGKAEESYFYDVILMDYNMPKMSGAEAALIIDEMINTQEIPSLVIIVCTANANHKEYEFHFRNGHLDHITKPFSKEELRNKIEKY